MSNSNRHEAADYYTVSSKPALTPLTGEGWVSSGSSEQRAILAAARQLAFKAAKAAKLATLMTVKVIGGK